MTEPNSPPLISRLRAFFEAIAAEAEANPGFAEKIWAAIGFDAAGEDSAKNPRPAAPPPKKRKLAEPVNPFDPLELHLETALMSGREQEARAFLARLDREQLEEVVKAQRLPGARALQKVIAEAVDHATAVDAIVDSAGAKIKGRHLAAS